MIHDIGELMNQHWQWLRDNTALRELAGDVIEITTPYIDRHNDMLQIYAQREGDGFLLTDDGYTLNDLEISGCGLDTPKRKSLLKETLNGFGVELHDGALRVRTSAHNFGFRKHSLVQTMLAVNDLFALSTPMVSSFFLEDVQAWLDAQDIRYTSRVKFTGKSGFDHLFEFVIPKSKCQPERLLQTVNRPGRDTAEGIAFKWFDIKEVRPPSAIAFAIINDSDHSVSTSVTEALKSYDIRPMLWSKREEFRENLAA